MISRREFWKGILGYALALACLVWVFHDVALGALWRDAVRIEWGWVGLAVVFDVLSYLCQGERWRLLLARTGDLPLWKATQAVYAGLFVNEMLPLRTGEVLRTWLAARWMNVPVSTVVPSVVVERFADAVWLALAIGLTVLVVPLPGYLVNAEKILAGVVFSATAGFVILVFRPVQLRGWLGGISAGIAEIGRSGRLYASLGVSGLLLLCQMLAYWLVMWGYGMRLPFWQGAAALLIVRLGTALPGAPSNVGTYQFFAVAGLTLFGVDKSTATGFSIVVFLILTVPLWSIGSVAFARAGLTLKGVRGGLAEVEEA